MHYYKRNIGDYHKKAGRLSMLEHGSYTLLLDACYDRERFPTLEEALEWTWARSESEIEAVKFVLSKFFKLSDDGIYIQERMSDEIARYQSNAETNARIAKEREQKRREKQTNRDSKSTNREQTVNEACGKTHEPPPNHKPLTTNQEPKDKSPCDQQAESRIPYAEIFDLYAIHLSALPQLKLKDEARKKAIRSIWRMDAKFQSAEFFARYFQHAGKSDFLMGRDSKGWRGCSFDWLMKPANFKKIIEGNYQNA